MIPSRFYNEHYTKMCIKNIVPEVQEHKKNTLSDMKQVAGAFYKMFATDKSFIYRHGFPIPRNEMHKDIIEIAQDINSDVFWNLERSSKENYVQYLVDTYSESVWTLQLLCDMMSHSIKSAKKVRHH
jgi:hypothetical protein